ncbi:hypothetical protein Tco_1429373 [Tanacetum coccineum]
MDWQSRLEHQLDKLITHEITVLVKDLLMPLAEKTRVNASEFEKVLKEEMFEDLQYVQSLEKELDALQSDKDEFSNEYDLLLQECLSKDIMCAILRSFESLDEKTELQCLYLEKHAEYDNLEIELSKCKSQFVELEKHYKTIANAEMRESWNKMKGKDVDTSFGKPLILGKPPLQPIRNQPVVRQPTAFKSERSSFLKTCKTSFAKPYHVNAPGPSRNSSKHVSFQSPKESVGSNDMVHNYYLEEATKKAQLHKDKALNSKPSVITPVSLPNTTSGSKPKPRISNQQPRNWPPSMSSRVINKVVYIAEKPRNQKPILKSKNLACPTCKKCIYSANHDVCILKYLSNVNSRASAQKKDAQSHKTTKRYIPVEKKINSKNHGRSGLTWKPTGRIFTYVSLRWIPIKKYVET